MIQKTLAVGPLQCNCQILVCPVTQDAVLIDPGADADRILAEVASIENKLQKQIHVRALLHTHAHFDHIGATKEVKQALGSSLPQIYLHQADEQMYHKLKMQGAMFGFPCDDPAPIDQFLQDDQSLQFGKIKMTVLHTPGHSPGGVCFRLHQDTEQKIPEIVFTGDTLFRSGVGRTDLWGGSESTLMKSIQNRLFTLDGDTVVWPGHGLSTRVGVEKGHFS
jgi:glyoxylase-like metal-dependent hydrolase (beta-lactamase superfamily II)